MNYREINCLVCGKKLIDRSSNQTRKFCDDYCAQEYYRRTHGIGVRAMTPPCIHNDAIRCEIHKCGNCGWNPRVELRRKEALASG